MIHNVRLSDGDADEIRGSAYAKDGRLPPRIGARLAVVSRLPNLAGISVGPFNVELSDLEPTPLGAAPAVGGGVLADATHILQLVAQGLGTVVTYAQMKQAKRPVQHVYPVSGLEGSESAASSLQALSWHSEHADKEIVPDWLAFFCLRNPLGIGTRVSRPRVNLLSGRTRGVLQRRGEFRFQTSGSVAETCVLDFSAPRGWEIRYDPLFQAPQSIQAKSAMAELTDEIDRQAQVLPQVPGYIAFLPNRYVVHGREPYIARFDGSDRWLIRCFVADRGRTLPGKIVN